MLTKTKNQKFVSPLRYSGGKSYIAKELINMFPLKFGDYYEPCVGGGSVFLELRTQDQNNQIQRNYHINDLYLPIVWMWKAFQDPNINKQLREELHTLHSLVTNHEEGKIWIKQFKKVLEKWTESNNWKSKNPELVLYGAQLAFFLNRSTYSGTILMGGTSKSAFEDRWTKSSIDRITPMIEALEDVEITGSDFEDILNKIPSDSFAYIDAPYFTTKGLYSLHRFDHERLSKVLKRGTYLFLATYDDCNEIKELYNWANIETLSVRYSMNRKNGKCNQGKEIIIKNY